MTQTSAPETIAVQSLRIGMYVHLEGGWMSHPFPVSNFRIASQEQIATLVSLGLRQVRWSPRKSVLADAQTPAESASEPVATPSVPSATSATSAPAAALAGMAPIQRQQVLAERAAQRQCEQQFAEAASECRQLTALVPTQPLAAGAAAHSLSRALADKMAGRHELCVRLLSLAAGDQASVHAMNVAVLSLLLGRVCGLEEAEMLDMGVGALLHDIGKLELPEAVRHLDDSFTPSQHRAYEGHVAQGVMHAGRMALSAGATLVIAQHHEHADGSGFPRQLGSERMSAASRIVSIVNRYDNLCNPHLAATAVTPHEALALLFAKGRAAFDDAVLGAFIRMLGIYPPGSTVQLTDDRYGIVVGANSSRPLRPRVRVHDPRPGAADALLIDLEATPGLGIRRSLKPAQLPPAALASLAPQSRVTYYFEPARIHRGVAECVD